jgi:predicted ATP-dependent endonuclease of OLD family
MQMLLIFIYLVDRIGHQRHHTSWGLPPLVLIDEPELSMHISWQRGFIDDLMDIFFNDSNHHPTGRYHRPQFIIATHSPSIVANHMHRGHELRALGFIENLEM